MKDGVKTPMTDAEIAEWEAHKAAVEAARPTELAKSVRRERDRLLAETDWWASSDLTMTVEQTAYRQALRDVTSQEGFPYTVTWPVKP